jgi:hypothetical protein
MRMAVRVEGYLLFLVRNRNFHFSKGDDWFNGSYHEAEVRGLECDDATLVDALKCQKQIRDLLENKVFRIVARWINKAKKDGHYADACMLHAHLAFIFRNVEPEQLNARIVFTLLASQIFLFNYFKYDIDVEQKSSKQKTKGDTDSLSDDLMIPQVELFDLYQRNRRIILEWLESRPEERNKVCF